MSKSDISAMLCLFIPAIVIGSYLGYALTKLNIGEQLAEQYEKQNAKQTILLLLGMIALILVVIYFSLDSWLWFLQLICAITLFGLTLHAIKQRRRALAAGILLDLGRIENKGFIVAGLMFALATGISVSSWRVNGQLNGERVIQSLFSASAALYWLGAGFSKVYVTPDGFSGFMRLIKWESLSGYQWAGQYINTVTLLANGKLCGSWSISRKQRESLEELLLRYLGPPGGLEAAAEGEASTELDSAGPMEETAVIPPTTHAQ